MRPYILTYEIFLKCIVHLYQTKLFALPQSTINTINFQTFYFLNLVLCYISAKFPASNKDDENDKDDENKVVDDVGLDSEVSTCLPCPNVAP